MLREEMKQVTRKVFDTKPLAVAGDCELNTQNLIWWNELANGGRSLRVEAPVTLELNIFTDSPSDTFANDIGMARQRGTPAN